MKKTILIVGDCILHTSGVANQLRHVVDKFNDINYNVITIGVINDNNVPQPLMDHSYNKSDTSKKASIYFANTYDDINLYEYVIKQHNVDAMILMTDPYRYQRYFQYAYSIRSKIPVYYISVWDTDLAPLKGGKYHYNLPLYENFDRIGCISKQTVEFSNAVMDHPANYSGKIPIDYVGHGSDPNIFKKVDRTDIAYNDIYNKLYRGRAYDYIVMLNSRNQARKKIPDLIEAYRLFTDSLSYTEKHNTALLLQTELSSEYGTNLAEVCAAIAPHNNIYINTDRVDESILNIMYNTADVVVNISNAEGFGLSANEAMLTERCLILNSTGGLKDQGNGKWCKYVSNNRTIIGNPATPYLYDNNANIDDVAHKIREWYDTPIMDRIQAGREGRQYCLDNGLTSYDFADKVVKGVNTMITEFSPIKAFNTYSI